MPRSQSKSQPKTAKRKKAKKNTISVPIRPYTSRLEDSLAAAPDERSSAVASHQLERIQKIAAGLFAAKGYRAIGVAEIGDAVGLGRGALYYHISSKEDLLFNIAARYMEKLTIAGQEAVEKEPDPRRRIYILSRQLLKVIFENLPEMTVCFRDVDCLTGQRHRVVSTLHQSYQDVWAATLREGEAKGVFRHLPTAAIKGILGMYFYSFLWLRPGGKSTAADIADLFAGMVLAIAESKVLKNVAP